jgi:hypothetical protein
MSFLADDLKSAMASKTDDELYDVVYGHPGDYMPEAIAAANLEFSSRKLDGPAISTLKSTATANKQIQEAQLRWSYRILAFFVSTIFFGIPVILAHRHFVEKGARRKAREWARWALFGFFFYLAISVMIRYL